MSDDENVRLRLGLREPLGSVIETVPELARTCAELMLGHGPVGLDAERASGYRYSQRAYLIQIRRDGAGTYLIDPTAFDDLQAVDDALSDSEWILHAATQDLACLAEVGMHPRSLFDTELASRLLNLPKVGLAGLVEHYLDLSLAKEYSAADWSTRPLPEPWLEYAALDVEVLAELRQMEIADLERTGKYEWAREEFDALLSFTGPPERVDPWRRTSGIHKLRGRRALAVVRSLWQARDQIAAERDITAGRVMPDALIGQLAASIPQDLATLKSSPAMKSRGPRRFLSQWHDAIEEALALPEEELPEPAPRSSGPPPPRTWADRNPAAAGRLARAKDAIAALCAEHDLPAENLLNPGMLRQLAWEPPEDIGADSLGASLRDAGAREWQIGLVSQALSTAFEETT